MLQSFSRTLKLMGNRFVITVVHSDYQTSNKLIDLAIEEIQRIEKLLTTYSENSQTYQINVNSGIRPFKVDQEVFDLIARSIKISELTDGAFDISYGSMDSRFWNFDQTLKKLPDPEEAKKTIALISRPSKCLK